MSRTINLDYSRIEFARLPRSARNDDVIYNICCRMRGTGYAAVVLHRKCPVTKQTSLRGAKRRGNLMPLANHLEIATLRSR